MPKRVADYPILDEILNRWSLRAMSGEPITDQELHSLFEAARWAPSSYNGQPWRFIYAKRETAAWDPLFNLLVPFNQEWAKNAAVLVVVVSRTTFEFNNKPSRTHSFDTGAALENLAIQGHAQGLVVHGMEGFDYNRAYQELGIPDIFAIEAMFAVGRPAPKEILPEEMQKREEPSGRKKITEFVCEGRFTFKA
ncbi:nitroreductase [Candidatus Dependentiae bacterium HGW-Dependentiae-1]|nr:MAG: nitroreductase [Candidatus Dependentiae bacterium HGW-Dependentiae-1]